VVYGLEIIHLFQLIELTGMHNKTFFYVALFACLLFGSIAIVIGIETHGFIRLFALTIGIVLYLMASHFRLKISMFGKEVVNIKKTKKVKFVKPNTITAQKTTGGLKTTNIIIPLKEDDTNNDSIEWTTFSSNEPTYKQFMYAVRLGVVFPKTVSFNSISGLIEKAKKTRGNKALLKIDEQRIIQLYEKKCSERTADRDSLKYIKEMHGVLPRIVTQKEADDIIEFLEEYRLPCPFCGNEIFAQDDMCLNCMKKLNGLRIPIELDKHILEVANETQTTDTDARKANRMDGTENRRAGT